MIATVCKSCRTINRAIIDRCKYCGSQRVETKFINDGAVKIVANSREIVGEINDNDVKARS